MPHIATALPPELAHEQERIRQIALDMGLDFFEVIFEMVDFQQMNEIAAYLGFPTRYPHWRWGMEYERMRKSYDYGLHKIYEMVINNDPCYAYLLESNELVDQKIVMAHVYGHCLAPETEVETENGVKAITEVQVGEKVLTHTGTYRAVRVRSQRHFKGAIHRIRVAGSNQVVRITGEHPMLVLRPAGQRESPWESDDLQWVPAAEIRAGDEVAFPRRQEPAAILEPRRRNVAHDLVWTGTSAHRLNYLLFGEDVIAGNRSFERSWTDEDYLYQTVKSVETEAYEGLVYNFSVEEDESYSLAAGFVVHNCDFFKNNLWFSRTSRKMMDEMANHATRVWRIIDRIGMEEVEEFIDVCLSLENLIDRHAPYRDEEGALPAASQDELEVDMRRPTVAKLRVERPYMDPFINPPEWVREEAERRGAELRARTTRFPDEPQRDVLLFLLNNAPLERWQHDILDIVRKEAYYFAPQGMTKVLNEGWACLRAGSLLLTDRGLLPIERVVAQRAAVRVSDGETTRQVYDWARFEERETVWLRTRRGYEVEGSLTHQLLLADGSWRRLDELQLGDCLQLEGGSNLWATEYVPITWAPRHRMTLQDGADAAAVSLATVVRFRKGTASRSRERLAPLVARYESELEGLSLMQNQRQPIRVPQRVDEALAALLGYQVGDGHISRTRRTIGLTTGDEEQATRYQALVSSLFGLQTRKKWEPNNWQVTFSSQDVEAFLVHLGLPTGRAARLKSVPDVILRSPQSVVAAFLRAYFDCDGYAGPAGFILPTASDALAQTVPLLLLNFGILSSRRKQADGCWRIQVMGQSARVLYEEIGFNLSRKQEALRQYVEAHRWLKAERWDTDVVAIERRRAPVYDVSVKTTHRYAAQGFINHNSYWHTTIMTRSGVMTDAEVVDYADHHSGTVAMSPQRINPYKIGLELLRDIEERWDKGRFGKEWEECDDARVRRAWDRQTGLGREKLFEVRRVYNDVGFVDTFFTEDFCNRHQLFTYHYNERTGRYEIESREFQAIKQRLLFSLTNFGQPVIEVESANHENRGALLLRHRYEGVELKLDEARDTLRNLFTLWKRPIYLRTVIDEAPRLLSFDGKEHATRRVR